MKKVLYVIPSLRPGGAERQLVELVKGLDKTRFLPVVVIESVSDSGYQPILEALGVKVYVINRTSKIGLKYLANLVAVIRSEQVDILHGFLTLSCLYALIAAKITQRPVISSALREAKDLKRTDKYINRLLAIASPFFVSNSQAGFKSRFKKNRKNFRVIYNGMCMDRFNGDEACLGATRHGLGVDPSQKIIIMVASLSPFKDHKTLIQAAKIVIDTYPDVIFLVVGEYMDGGKRKRELQAMSDDLGIAGSVKYLGFRSDVDLLVQLASISVLLTNSDVHAEGTPNALIEAMAAGRPVIGSKGGGTDETLDHGKSGILIPPKCPKAAADAILSLLNDPVMAFELARAGQASARLKYNYQSYIENYELLYDTV